MVRKIRQAAEKDLGEIMRIYADAREFMRASGNPFQWGSYYPTEEQIQTDIAQNICYVCIDSATGDIEAVFVFEVGEDATYRVIENGRWLNDDVYGVIHRLAGRQDRTGTADVCMRWCFAQWSNLRCDTHKDNKVMQHILQKHGFVRCGKIYLEDGSPRIAFQKYLQ